jgi:hypothetical protein
MKIKRYLIRLLKRTILIFMGLLIFLILTDKVYSSSTLVVNPKSLIFNIPSGRLDTTYIEVTNLRNNTISVTCDFDTDWMLLFPSKFKLLAKQSRKVLAIFFIKRGEDPEREGKIIFRTKNSQNQTSLKVSIYDPFKKKEEAKESELTKVEEKKRKEERLRNKVKKEIEVLENKIKHLVNCLKEELKKKEEEELKALSKSPREKKIEERKKVYEYLLKNLREEIKRGEIQIAWLGDNFSITILGSYIFDLPSFQTDKNGLMEILDKIKIVLKKNLKERGNKSL